MAYLGAHGRGAGLLTLGDARRLALILLLLLLLHDHDDRGLEERGLIRGFIDDEQRLIVLLAIRSYVTAA